MRLAFLIHYRRYISTMKQGVHEQVELFGGQVRNTGKLSGFGYEYEDHGGSLGTLSTFSYVQARFTRKSKRLFSAYSLNFSLLVTSA